MVKLVADVAKAQRLIGNAFSTQNTPQPFIELGPDPEIVFGSNRARRYDAERVGDDFTANGAYWCRDRFASEPIRVAILNTV
ncbi:hypothetical protein NL393_34965, partial [Klebsiella pneumoniae]|nr:hypothetical protein [Klebsiella pneumoniae]